ncbi:dipeptidase [Aneurinibacillus aneurinilyticus]|uniref:Renal dipeptidase family protein n=1 Tax=Aneurinibacillus aneurinilyticus ATCC 12856 TaxID=649747 RepID=U1X628_ANEAE|nr:membrane dipeptidase [Aneurinibacillus aneurinilyticus]ERI10430.1 renal dipeptidase family protein [Aneurinibacillus aneurinilyticus ATCC 12856]MED0709026.1 membrane dipeptidase [Aneurinibacillus aneurinilyticus]MED0725420.1 membrane dipeptidase [Aneurinibacillus aneurinilyticus]MED0730731.1 membrane dipeptidase [Aneurinibacillus aneurinilyticus]MED0740925.1 membrane dipeptidase [Aneurinibacillus aneurinilyticus]
MNRKKYDGYTSFDYLKPHEDYRVFELAKAIHRVPQYGMNLTPEQSKAADEILEKHLIISLRDHGFITPHNQEHMLDYCRQMHTFFHYEGLAKAGIDAIFENFMDGIVILTSKFGLKWDDIILNLGMRLCDIAHQQTIFIANSVSDIKAAKRDGRIALIPSLEAAGILENEIDRVDVLYGFGIRCMGITYNEANTLGSGLAEEKDGGLTSFGKRVIRRMNKVGMAIDISHCGDKTSMDVIQCSEKPVLLTHAGARALWNTPRMKPDKVLKACTEAGGVIGICAAPNTTLTRNQSAHCIEAVMEHLEYIIHLVGIDHVGLGPDTFYGDHVALQHAFDESLSISASHRGEAFEESPYVAGLENPTEAIRNMVRWMVKHGYREEEISKITGGNVLRALEEIWSK